MGFHVNSLSLSNFRNYDRLNLPDLSSSVIIVGPNAVGKTNIIEGISISLTGKSFRSASSSHYVKNPAKPCVIECSLEDGSRKADIRLEIKEGKKKHLLNGKAKKTSSLFQLLPIVSFTPDDLEISKKSSSIKRDALDSLGGKIYKSYRSVHRDFEKMLHFKNTLLKEGADDMVIKSANDTFALCSAQLSFYRSSLLTRIAPDMQQSYDSISTGNERLSFSYVPSWSYMEDKKAVDQEKDDRSILGKEVSKNELKEIVERELDSWFEREKSLKRSVIGAHNDKINIFLEGMNVTTGASQGQQRSVVLAWKMAEMGYIFETLGALPVLLLDDVMSELDENRRKILMSMIKDKGMQVFITAADLGFFNNEDLESFQIIHLPLEACYE